MNRPFYIVLILLLPAPFACLRGDPASAPLKDYKGIYSLFPGQKPDQSVNIETPIWQSDCVEGMALRSTWSVIESKKGEFDWSLFDRADALAKQHNKKISLSVAAGGSTPGWVMEEGAASLTITVTHNWKASETATMPLPWDPIFQKEWGQLIQAMAARYDQNPHVAYVAMGGPGDYIETYFVRTPDDYARFVQAGGLPKWIKGTEQIIDLYGSAFKHTPFILALANPVNRPEGQEAVREVVEYGMSRYPGRFGISGHGLNALSATRGLNFYVNQLIQQYASSAPTGFQLVGPAQKLNTGDLAQAVGGGIKLGAGFIEVYEQDCQNPEYGDLLKNSNSEIRSR